MRESFVFYRSFYETLWKMPEPDRLEACEALIRCALNDETPDDLPYPINAIVNQMLADVRAAQKRYEQSIENGKKGGRPSAFVHPSIWVPILEQTRSIPKTAKKVGRSPNTLRNYISILKDSTKAEYLPYKERVQKLKNLTVTDTDADTVTDAITDTVTNTETVSSNSNLKTNAPVTSATDPNGSPPCPSKKKAVDPFFEQMRKEYGLTDEFGAGADEKDGDT